MSRPKGTPTPTRPRQAAGGIEVDPAAQSATGARLNRRGIETRRHVLAVAVEVLAEGGPESVSANLVAKQAGVTWGTIQHQFGDADGVWAAVLDHLRVAADRWLPAAPARSASAVRRIGAIVESLWDGYGTPPSRAVRNLRVALPHDPDVLRRDYPRTAASLHEFEREWNLTFDRLFEGLGTSPTKLRRVRSLLPGAVLGLHLQQQQATDIDPNEAKRGLIDALVAYLA